MANRLVAMRRVAMRRVAMRLVAMRLVAAVALAALLAGGAAVPGGPGSALSGAPGPVLAAGRPPVLAYYYMWFNKASWTRAKTDLPSLGAYDSTDPAVIRQQVAWARESGVDAFIVSWKHTPKLDLALAELVAECRRQGLKLVLIYEGLDVQRNAIPATTVAADLTWFAGRYAGDPIFDVYGRPAVIWSGSWKFDPAEIAAVRSQIGAPGRLLLLGSEKDGASYAARASLFDGDAYYWSSADPGVTPGYQRRLGQLAAAVHADHGLWLAPAAVGFDARLNGGTSVVDRRDGATLRAAWAAALATAPDGVAVISWNEYTENSYVEPSRNYGFRYLTVLASLTGAPGPAAGDGGAGAAASPAASPAPSAASAAIPGAGQIGGGPTSPGPAAAATRAGQFSGLASLVVAGLVLAGLGALAITWRRRPSQAGTGDPEHELDA